MRKNLKDGHHDHLFTFRSFKGLLAKFGKANGQIAKEIKEFCKPVDYWNIIGIGHKGNFPESIVSKSKEVYYDNKECWDKIKTMDAIAHGLYSYDVLKSKDEVVEFYAYYADYDWVVFCWLFGKMLDLPKGFPMYCRDLKQMLDVAVDRINLMRFDDNSPKVTVDSMKKNNPFWPKQENEHTALPDARWNKNLYFFLNNLFP